MPTATKYYTPEQANRSLPLVRAIVGDICQAAVRARAIASELHGKPNNSHARHLLEVDLEDTRHRLGSLHRELDELGIELKDEVRGLIDFRALRGQDEVYLCWQHGEERVAYWHPIAAGFAGRQPIETL
jgi:hypothetical protein